MDPEKLEKKAVEEFGTTDLLLCAGFILSDGTMLDFCDIRGGGTYGLRARDHREIAIVVPASVRKKFENKQGPQTNAMRWFMEKTGAIRFKPEAGGAEFPRRPTWPQVSAIVNNWRASFGRDRELIADVWVNGDPRQIESIDVLIDRNFIAGQVDRLAHGLGAPLLVFEADGDLPFYHACVNWPKKLMPALNKLIADERQIRPEEFLHRVENEALQNLVADLGFHDFEDFVDAADSVTTYHEVIGYENEIVYFSWSGIEHVFGDLEDIEALNRQAKQEDF
jgi:hypothetical protein